LTGSRGCKNAQKNAENSLLANGITSISPMPRMLCKKVRKIRYDVEHPSLNGETAHRVKGAIGGGSSVHVVRLFEITLEIIGRLQPRGCSVAAPCFTGTLTRV
jgi:hypothetical protein